MFARIFSSLKLKNILPLSLEKSSPWLYLSSMAQEGKFLYFAYGSNLWTKRIHENNRSAKMVAVAKLQDYKLDFGHWTQRWKGASANILPTPGAHVYGVLWQLDQSDQASLDKQEGVCDKIYRRIELNVETYPEGKNVNCVAYQILDETRQKSLQAHGNNLIPSLRYKNVIIRGAKEHSLPQEYIKMLEALPDNGYNGDIEVNIPLA